MTTLGADISHYQTVTDYGKARAALDFYWIKITEGASTQYPTGIVDSKWKQHFTGLAKAAGEAVQKVRGPYHFMRGVSATEIDLCESQHAAVAWEGDLMLDAEYPGVGPAAIKAWIAMWRQRTGRYFLWVYVNASFLSTYGVDGFIDDGVLIWGARYWANSPDFATLGWDHPQLGVYQYWNAGTVPGFAGAVDLDVSRVDMHARSTAQEGDFDMASLQTIDIYTGGADADGYYTVPLAVECGPVGKGGNSQVVKSIWLRLAAAYGTCEFNWVFLSGTTDVGDKVIKTSGTNVWGTLADRGSAVWQLPDGCTAVALKWRPLNSGARLALSLAQTNY